MTERPNFPLERTIGKRKSASTAERRRFLPLVSLQPELLRVATDLQDECVWPQPPPTDRLIAWPEKALTHGKTCADPNKDAFSSLAV